MVAPPTGPGPCGPVRPSEDPSDRVCWSSRLGGWIAPGMALSSLDLSSAGAAHTDPGPIGGSTPGPSGASEARSKPGARGGSMGGSLGR